MIDEKFKKNIKEVYDEYDKKISIKIMLYVLICYIIFHTIPIFIKFSPSTEIISKYIPNIKIKYIMYSLLYCPLFLCFITDIINITLYKNIKLIKICKK